MNNGAIGIFDSGLGGLSLWQRIYELLPEESLIYFGDGVNCPYGELSHEQIYIHTDFGVRTLLSMGAKIIVLACNTATGSAITRLRETYPDTHFVGMEPAVKPAALASHSGVIAVLATRASFAGEHYLRTSALFKEKVRIIEIEGKGFVELVEEGKIETPEALEVVKRAVEPAIAQGADKIVLGCTHYPFLSEELKLALEGTQIDIIDPGEAVARRTADLLDRYLLRVEPGQTALHRMVTLADRTYLEKMKALIRLRPQSDLPDGFTIKKS